MVLHGYFEFNITIQTHMYMWRIQRIHYILHLFKISTSRTPINKNSAGGLKTPAIITHHKLSTLWWTDTSYHYPSYLTMGQTPAIITHHTWCYYRHQLSLPIINSVHYDMADTSWYAFSMVFHVKCIFLTLSLRIPRRLQRGWDSETSGEKSVSHGKSYKMHFLLAYFTRQGTLVMLKIFR